MQIKVITCHEVYNHGAILQEYALLHYLNSQKHDAEVIHYAPWYLRNNYDISYVPPKYDVIGIKQMYILAKYSSKVDTLKRKDAFDLFTKKHIRVSTNKYKSNQDLIDNLPEADAFICGSDQIWNSLFENGKDPAFYLNFVPNHKIKIAYAASFAIECVEKEYKELAFKNLSLFKAISVRETTGIKILEEIGIGNAKQVLDPVFLLSREHWNSFTDEIDGKFIFVYDFDSDPLIKKVATYLQKQFGYKIYTVNQNIKYADKNFYTEGPEKFLSLVRYSQYNITNSFHALTFSLIFKKEVVVMNRFMAINTRMRDLLNLLQIERLVTNFDEFLALQPINYLDVSARLTEKITYSQNFLTESLK